MEAEEAQALARESSLVCRENAKLRAQLAELQAAREEDSSSFRATIASHPTSHDLAQADAALTKSEDENAELEQALGLARDAITSLQGRLATQEAGQVAQAAEASIKYSEAERELRAEMCALSAELAAARSDAQDKHGRSAAAEAERAAAAEAARRQTETHAERVASLQAELREARELLISMQGEQATGGADAATLRVALARAEAEAAEGRRRAEAAAMAAAEAARVAAEAAEVERRAAAEALQELLRESKRSLLAARQDAKDGRAAREQAATEAAEAATEAARLAEEAARRGAAEAGRLKREVEAERGRAHAGEARGTDLERELEALRADLAEAVQEVARLRAELESEGRQEGRQGSARRAEPAAVAGRSAFGEYVTLKRELAEARQSNAQLVKELAASRLPRGPDQAVRRPSDAASGGLQADATDALRLDRKGLRTGIPGAPALPRSSLGSREPSGGLIRAGAGGSTRRGLLAGGGR